MTTPFGRRRWDRRESMLVYRLYCELPFGKMDQRNANVIELASQLGRSPGSIALKLVNFAHLDPALRARGIQGMGHVSELDREVAAAFASDWDEAIAATSTEWSTVDEDPLPTEPAGPSEATANVRVRLTQRFFRRAVLSAYESGCCICRISPRYLLVASHIVPWASAPEHRSNPQNGLALCGLHDRAFDAGQLTVLPNYVVEVSESLLAASDVPVSKSAFRDVHGAKMTLPSRFLPATNFLEYHNVHIFKG